MNQIRQAYQKELEKIAAVGFTPNIFTTKQMEEIIARTTEEFQEEPEYLWEKFPTNAIIRRKDNRKWYAVLVKIMPEKIGLVGENAMDVVVLRGNPAEISHEIAEKIGFLAYHMNKKN